MKTKFILEIEHDRLIPEETLKGIKTGLYLATPTDIDDGSGTSYPDGMERYQWAVYRKRQDQPREQLKLGTE